jgi:tetratricopeptide (TPR) repeat protein
MNWKDLLSGKDLDLVTGVENTLRSRRRAGSVVIVLTALLQVALLVGNSQYLQKVAGFMGKLVIGPRDNLTAGMQVYELIGVSILILGVTVFVLARWSRVLLKETGEPFRYTFWIDAFRPVPTDDASAAKVAHFDLLQYDLRERLNFRIRRLSLLDDTAGHLDEAQRRGLIAHIHIAGEYAVRADRDREGKVHDIAVRIMPRVRIGPPGQAETLTTPVEIVLPPDAQTTKNDGSTIVHLDSAAYERAVERSYSRIAHEIYRRIKVDLGDKVTLFPTAYMRAVALYHEAQDFERSNTIDAYDYALELYREANRYFDTRLLGPLSRALARVPLLWLLVRRSLLMEAQTKIGYARCLIYRRAISAISGRYQNPLFVIPGTINKVIGQLERVHRRLVAPGLRVEESLAEDPGSPEVRRILLGNRFKQLLTYLTFVGDSPTRRWEKLNARLRETLFQAYSVGALGYSYLDASQRAQSYLENARAIAPRLCEQNALWLLAAAECEVHVDSRLQWLERAAEQDPEFEIALYRRAFFTEMRLRSRNEIEQERVHSVIAYYDRVLELNPANIGALAATGYLQWLIGDLKKARQRYEEGLEIKAIVSQTFIGDLSYGLARVVAEEGDRVRAFQLFSQALSADPAVGAFSKGSSTQQVSAFFEYIGPDMLARFDAYEAVVRGTDGDGWTESQDPSSTQDEPMAKTRRAVYSYVLNDCGNAYLNAFFRGGDDHHANRAVSFFERSIRMHPDNCAAYFNLDQAYTWSWDWTNRIEDCLEKARKLAPAWPALAIESVRSRRNRAQSDVDGARYNLESREKELTEKQAALDQTLTELETAEVQLESARSTGATAPVARPVVGKEAAPTKAQYGPGVQSLDPNLPERLKKKKERLEQDISSLKRDIEDSRRRLPEKLDGVRLAISEASEKIANETKLSFIFDYKEVSEVVDVLTASSVQWDRLDQNDVEALITFADFLSQSPNDEALLLAAERFANYILEHYPENYQAYLCLDRVLMHRIQTREMKLQKSEQPKNPQETLTNLGAQNGGGEAGDNALQEARSPDQPQHTEPKLGSQNGGGMAQNKATEALTRNPYRAHIERILHGRLTTNLNRFTILHDVAGLLDKDEDIQRFLKDQPDYAEHKDTYLPILARSYVHRYRWEEAIELYKTVLRGSPSNTSALVGLALIFSRGGKWAQAIRLLRSAVLLAPKRRDYLEALAASYHGAGTEHFERKRGDKAIESFRLASETDPLKAEYHASLSMAWEAVAPHQRVTALTLAAVSMKKACELAPLNADYQERARRLNQVLHLSDQYGEDILDMKAEIDPIVIKIGKGLTKLVWQAEGDEYLWDIYTGSYQFKNLIREMTGLEAPPILFLRDHELPERSYSFELWGIPVAKSEVPEGKRLLKKGLESLQEIGVAGEEVDRSAWWINSCCWFDESDVEKVEQAALEVWAAIDPMWLHFGYLIRNHMIDLIGYQSILKMLSENASTASYQITGSPETVSALGHVMRMLAMEKVPITALPEICERFVESHEEGLDAISIVERIRRVPTIRENLQGNDKNTPLLRLSEDFEKLIQNSIRREKACSVLAIEAAPCQEALSAIRDAVEKGPNVMALLVEKEEIRPFVRRLVELEFPYFWVLSRPEVEDEKNKSVAESRVIKDRFIRLPGEVMPL